MKCKNCGCQLSKEIKFCPRCGAPNERKGVSKPLLISLICLTVVVVSLTITFVTLMLHNKSGNPGTFDFTCSQYTEEMNRILGEKKLDQDKWVINDTSAEYDDTGFEIDLDIEEKSKLVSKISVGPADSEDAVKIAAVSIMVAETELTQKDVLDQLADLKEEKQDKIENDNSTVTIDNDKNRFVIEPRPDKDEKTDVPATKAQPATIQPTTEAKHEYTAAELIEKDLGEIVEIMGGDFEITNSKSVAFGTDGSPLWIYNDSTLPGFSFCPKIYWDHSSDFSDVKDDLKNEIKTAVNNGERDYKGLIATGSAKYNDTLSADTTYTQLAERFGDFDLMGVGTEGHYYHSEDIDGRRVGFCFIDSDQRMYERSTNGKISAADLSELNPTLSEIIVNYTGSEKPTTETLPEWKKLYIDHINKEYSNYSEHATPQYALAKIDDDDIPELLVRSIDARSMIDNFAYFIWFNGSDIKTENALVSEYKEKGETFYSEALTHGYNFVSYRFDGTNLSSVHKALNYLEKRVDGETADDATYNAAVAEIQTYGDTKPDYVSKDEIISQIEQY